MCALLMSQYSFSCRLSWLLRIAKYLIFNIGPTTHTIITLFFLTLSLCILSCASMTLVYSKYTSFILFVQIFGCFRQIFLNSFVLRASVFWIRQQQTLVNL